MAFYHSLVLNLFLLMLQGVTPNMIVATKNFREDLNEILANRIKITKEFKNAENERPVSNLFTLLLNHVKREQGIKSGREETQKACSHPKCLQSLSQLISNSK